MEDLLGDLGQTMNGYVPSVSILFTIIGHIPPLQLQGSLERGDGHGDVASVCHKRI